MDPDGFATRYWQLMGSLSPEDQKKHRAALQGALNNGELFLTLAAMADQTSAQLVQQYGASVILRGPAAQVRLASARR